VEAETRVRFSPLDLLRAITRTVDAPASAVSIRSEETY